MNDIIIHKNINWYKTVGEIDAIIMDKYTKEILGLIEIKARCFDIF